MSGVRDEHASHGQWRIVGCEVSGRVSWRIGKVAAATPKLTTHPVITMTTAIPVCGVSVLVGQAHRHAVWMVDFSTGKILTERELWK